MTTQNTPREIDTKLAELWHERDAIEQRIASIEHTMLSLAGASYYYRGRRRVTDMTIAEAIETLRNDVVEIDDYKRANAYTDGDYTGTDWTNYSGRIAPYDADKPAEYLRKYDDVLGTLGAKQAEIDATEALYTGWSRFFLVTSSAGHVHRSTHCSTCRPTTRYGWLPQLSGKSDADAVEELGPTLCTVCYPDAPVEFTLGKKLTAAQAAKRAA